MPKITINKDRCKGCLLCVSVCPKGLISQDNDLNLKGIKPVQFSCQVSKVSGGIPPEAGRGDSDCIGCSMCAIICPDCCIEVYR